MQKIILITACLFMGRLFLIAAENKYPVSEIPDSLLKNAKAVVRLYQTEVHFIDKSLRRETSHYVITILNKSADNLANLHFFYDKLIKLNSYKAFIYDKDGKQIKKIKNSEFTDISSTDGGTLFSDDRTVYYDPTINNYPYTVEYEVSYDNRNMLSTFHWVSINYYDVSVQNASVKVIVNKPLKYKFKTTNDKDSALITKSETNTTYSWKCNNLLPVEYEPFTNDLSEQIFNLKFALTEFVLNEQAGSSDNWETYSSYFSKLSFTENILSENTKSEIKQIVALAKSEEEKIKSIYEYMQKKTRYVSIQLGVGGYKPFDASVVDKLGYGDCKALVNYTLTLLKEAGIYSIYTLVKAGDDVTDINQSFVSNQFNHVILCIPLEKDTIWLECTSQKCPFNFLGDFTGNRHALLVLPEKGKLVYTQRYAIEDNLQSRKATVTLVEKGISNAKVETKYYGMQYDNRFFISLEGKEDQKRWLYDNTSLPGFTLKDFGYENKKDSKPELTENLTIDLQNYCSNSGKRLFVPLNLLNKSGYIPPTTRPRRNSIVLSNSYYDCDTIIYRIPEGYKAEFIPEPKQIKTEFGEYFSSVSLSDNHITYIRTKKGIEGTHPKEKYSEFVNYFKQVNQADNVKIALVKE